MALEGYLTRNFNECVRLIYCVVNLFVIKSEGWEQTAFLETTSEFRRGTECLDGMLKGVQ